MNILVCGRMKEGKTSFALWLARNWKAGCAVAFDPRHMIDEEMARHAGFEKTIIVEDAEELQENIEAIQAEKDEDTGHGTLIVFRPSGFDLSSQFDEMAGILFEPPERYHNWALIVDEAATLQSSHSIVPHLSRAVRQHPRSVLIIQTTHSLQDWHRASKDLQSHLFCFRLMGRSLQSVVEFCDASEEMEQTIKTLPPHHLVHVDFEAHAGGPEFEVIDDPSIWWISNDDERLTEKNELEYKDKGREKPEDETNG